MALVLSRHPELKGLQAFLEACEIQSTVLNAKDKFYHVVVGGVPLRISEDLEYIVESDLFVLKSVTSDREILTNIVNHSYRIRTGYRTARVESRVGYKRQIKYRELRGDSEAKVFISKCKSTGGPAPPTRLP